MSLSRRRFLQVTGVTFVAVVGGSVYRAVDQGVLAVGEGAAYAPWKDWRTASNSPQERIVQAAILASNPHNSQPWRFRIEPNRITLYADPLRQIGTVDPFLREMHIGLGCAVENMVLAAQAEGFRVDVALMPNADDSATVAELTLSAGEKVISPLYNAIPDRRTNRAAYDTEQPIASATLVEIDALNGESDLRLFWFHTDSDRARFAEIAIGATEALIHDDSQSTDSHQWWRHDWDAVQERRDGITMDAQGMDDFIAAMGKMLPDVSRTQADSMFFNTVKTVQVPTAAAFGIIAVPNRMDARQRLNAGRLWQRIHLWATTQGIAQHPLNQMCERADREIQLGIEPEYGDAIRVLLNEAGWHGIMPFRMGYPTRDAKLSPRRSLDQVRV